MYENIKVLLYELELDTLDYMLTSDLKMGRHWLGNIIKSFKLISWFSFCWGKILVPAVMLVHIVKVLLPGRTAQH